MSGQKNLTMDADAPVADNQHNFEHAIDTKCSAADEALAIAKDVTRYTNAKLAATDYPGPSGTQMIATSSPVEAHGSGVCARMNSRSGAAELKTSPTGPVLTISAADQSDSGPSKRTELGFHAALLGAACIGLLALAACDEHKPAAAAPKPAVGVRPAAMKGVEQVLRVRRPHQGDLQGRAARPRRGIPRKGAVPRGPGRQGRRPALPDREGPVPGAGRPGEGERRLGRG